MRYVLLTAAFIVFALSSASAKTVRECDAEYAANKAAIQGVQTKAAFVTACRAGAETIPGVTPAAAPAPAAAAQQPAPTAAAPPPALTGLFGRRKAAPIAAAPAPAPAAAGQPSGANQFAAAAQAQARCPGQTVVWVNTNSGVYHFAGTRNYGATKAGAYMCEADATAAGDRASKKEHHP